MCSMYLYCIQAMPFMYLKLLKLISKSSKLNSFLIQTGITMMQHVNQVPSIFIILESAYRSFSNAVVQ